VIEAVITGAVAIVVCLISNHYQNKRTAAANQETITLIDYKLSELTKRVDKHNNVVERTYKLEEAVCLQDEKLRVANHRIGDLEEKEK